MTSETETDLAPESVLEAARRFFVDEDSPFAASPVAESPGHLTLATFRSRVAIAAFPDPEGGKTRVRVSTLRPDESVDKFLALIRTAGARAGESAG